jgi:type VII secretion-associated serine protease mycosin
MAVVGALLPAVLATPARADDVRDRQWHLTTLHLAESQRLSTGSGITVAVVDTGVDARHIDLVGNVQPGIDLTDPGGDGRTDRDGHGTAMASLIAGHGHGQEGGSLGVAPQTQILPVRQKAADGLDRGETAGGIRWAVDHNADVISLSLHGADTPDLREAVDYALGRDVVVVAAVGLPGGLGKVPAPANIPGVVAVAGVDQAGAVVASASGPEVAIAAPGKDIAHATKGGGYALGTGTSDATAIVSGVVALIRAKFPDLDAANVINRLIRTADDKGPPGRDPRYGFGIVNPVRALIAEVPSIDRNPLLASIDQSRSVPPASHVPSQQPPSVADTSSGSPWIWFGAGLVALIIAGLIALRASPNRRHESRTHKTGSNNRAR